MGGCHWHPTWTSWRSSLTSLGSGSKNNSSFVMQVLFCFTTLQASILYFLAERKPCYTNVVYPRLTDSISSIKVHKIMMPLTLQGTSGLMALRKLSFCRTLLGQYFSWNSLPSLDQLLLNDKGLRVPLSLHRHLSTATISALNGESGLHKVSLTILSTHKKGCGLPILS